MFYFARSDFLELQLLAAFVLKTQLQVYFCAALSSHFSSAAGNAKESRGHLTREGSVEACSMAITKSQGRISVATRALKTCSQLPTQKAVGDAAQYENKTSPNISLYLLDNREHHVTITLKSSSLECAGN